MVLAVVLAMVLAMVMMKVVSHNNDHDDGGDVQTKEKAISELLCLYLIGGKIKWEEHGT